MDVLQKIPVWVLGLLGLLMALGLLALIPNQAKTQPLQPPPRPSESLYSDRAYAGRVENVQNTEPFYTRLKEKLSGSSPRFIRPTAGEIPQNNRTPNLYGHGGGLDGNHR